MHRPAFHANRYHVTDIVNAIIIIIATTPPPRALLFDYTSPASIIIFDDTSSRSLTCYWLQHAQSLQEKGIAPQEKGSVDTLDTPPLPQQNIDPEEIDSEEIDSEEIREVRQSRDSEKVGEVCQVCQACKEAEAEGHPHLPFSRSKSAKNPAHRG